MTNELFASLREHGDIWCMDLSAIDKLTAKHNDRQKPARVPRVKGSVAVIPVHGVITKRGSWFSDGLDRLSRVIDTAMNTKEIGGIVLDIDSPGGSSYGLSEFADKVYSLRGQKPIVAVANPIAASAAYWVGTSADMLAVTPSGDVGSVGVWSLHVDYSEMLATEGIKPTFIFAGEHKVDGNPYEPLSDEAKADMQASVDETYNQFVAAIARNTDTPKAKVISDFGQGRVLSAKAAKAAGMVSMVASLDDVIAKMIGDTGGNASRSAANEASEKHLLSAWSDTPEERAEEQEQERRMHVEAMRLKRERQKNRD